MKLLTYISLFLSLSLNAQEFYTFDITADTNYFFTELEQGFSIGNDSIKNKYIINCEIIDWVWYKINKDFSKEEYCKLISQEIDIKMYNTTECTE